MKTLILIAWIIPAIAYGQSDCHPDSSSLAKVAWQIVLDETEVKGNASESDKNIFSFYKSDRSSSTEEIISRIPGFSLIRRGSYAQEPVYRGMSGSRLNITIDGMRISTACTDKMDPATSYIETENLSKINILKGEEGVFASPSSAGLDMGLARASFLSPNQLNGSFSTRLQSNAPGISNVTNLNYASDKLALRLSGVYRKVGEYNDGNNKKVPYSSFNKANTSLSARYRINSNGIIDFDMLFDHAWNIGYPALSMDVAYARAKIFGLQYQRFFNSSILNHILVKVYGNKIDHLMDDSQREEVAVKMDMPGSAYTTGGFAEGDFKSLKNQKLKLKVELFQTYSYAEMTMFYPGETDMFMLTWPGIKRNVSSVSLSQSFEWMKNEIQLSARADMASTSINKKLGKQQLSVFNINEPNRERYLMNINSSYKKSFNKFLSTKISFSRTERLPDASEEYGFYIFNKQDNYDYIGSPYLQNEKAFQGELSLEFQKDHILIKSTGFLYSFRDFISGVYMADLSPMTLEATGVKEFRNIGKAVLLGGETFAHWQFADHWSYTGSINYVYGEDENKHPLPQIPPLKGNIMFKFLQKSYWFQLEGDFSSAQNRINPYFNEFPTRSFFVLNLRGSKEFRCKNSSYNLSGGVENILNKQYREHLDWGNIYKPGRNFYVNATWAF